MAAGPRLSVEEDRAIRNGVVELGSRRQPSLGKHRRGNPGAERSDPLARRHIGATLGQDFMNLRDRGRVLEHRVVPGTIVAEADNVVATLDHSGDYDLPAQIDGVGSAPADVADFHEAAIADGNLRHNAVVTVHRPDFSVVEHELVVPTASTSRRQRR